MVNIITSDEMVYNENAVYRFVKTVQLDSVSKSTLNLFAEARYKLYINGRLAAVGPCKGAAALKYYDTVDITDFLRIGENRIEISVLQLAAHVPEQEFAHLTSVMHEGGMVLAVWGNAGGVEISADSSWLCAKQQGWGLIKPVESYYVGMNEHIGAAFHKAPRYRNAVVLCGLQRLDDEGATYTEMRPWVVRKRPIPMMYFKERAFADEKGGIYDAGEVTCGYVRVKFSGRGRAKLIYAESKVIEENGERIKRRRDDENGIVTGDYDIIEIEDGFQFESWWFRTFRYIRAELEGVQIEQIDYIEMGYPLELCGTYDFGSDTDNRLFEISLRTLRRCMHETYEDCPYYEQLQYAMDTHLQMLFTYQLTNDDRLARKAIDDFASSYICGTITQSRFPSMKPQYIVGFSLFFIFMLHAHAKRFSDFAFVGRYMHIADGILDWFLNRLEDGMVRRSNYWNFIDWAEGYDFGQQLTRRPSAIHSLMLAKALEEMAWLQERCGGGKDYSAYAAAIKQAVQQSCYDSGKGLYSDSDEKLYYSQHTQIWAVLCGLVEGEQAAALLQKSKALTSRATFAYMFYLARAMEKAGIYAAFDQELDAMRGLTKLGCTTMPEVPGEHSRSECHAWSSLALYEFTAKVLGMTVEEGVLYIKPFVGKRRYAKGVCAAFGSAAECEWKVEDGKFKMKVSLPEGRTAVITMPDGSVLEGAGSGEYECAMCRQ